MLRRHLTVVVAALITFACGRQALELPSADLLSGQAVIRRDTYGIPHILADTEEAAAFAFGYAQAEDHAAEIGRRYLSARGEAARQLRDRCPAVGETERRGRRVRRLPGSGEGGADFGGVQLPEPLEQHGAAAV